MFGYCCWARRRRRRRKERNERERVVLELDGFMQLFMCWFLALGQRDEQEGKRKRGTC
jgi:hypothetical protein